MRAKTILSFYFFDSGYGTILFGVFGTEPAHLVRYLDSKGVGSAKYNTIEEIQSKANNMKANQQIILCFWIDSSDITQGAHYITVEKKDNTYYAYNSKVTSASSLKGLFPKGSLITSYLIG